MAAGRVKFNGDRICPLWGHVLQDVHPADSIAAQLGHPKPPSLSLTLRSNMAIRVARIIGFVAIAHAMEQPATVLEKGRQEGIQVPQRLCVVRSVGLEGLQDMRAAGALQERL